MTTTRIPEHTLSGRVVLSPTRVGLGMHCMRKHLLADTLSQRPSNAGDAPSLEFGTRIHHAEALWWETGDPAIGTEYLRAKEWPLDTKHHLGLALACHAAYVSEAQVMPWGQGDPWEVIALEERVVLEVEPGLDLSFQLDRLVRNQATGALGLADIKTAARCDARWAQQWSRDLQMKLYAEATYRKYGTELSWLWIEGIAKDTPKLHLVMVPEVSAAMRAEAWRNFRWVAQHDLQLIESATVDGVVDLDTLVYRALVESPHDRSQCFSYGHPCDYLRLCDAEPELRPALLAEGFEYVEPDYV